MTDLIRFLFPFCVLWSVLLIFLVSGVWGIRNELKRLNEESKRPAAGPSSPSLLDPGEQK